MVYNVKVVPKNGESSSNLLRRFSRSIMSSGIAMRTKKNQHFTRTPAKATRKKERLLRLKKTKDYTTQLRLGKVTENGRKRNKRN